MLGARIIDLDERSEMDGSEYIVVESSDGKDDTQKMSLAFLLSLLEEDIEEYVNDKTMSTEDIKSAIKDAIDSLGDITSSGANKVYISEALSASNEEDDIDIIKKLIPQGIEVQNGDIAIVKRYISGESGAISYTSYVYDIDVGWAATDGNYSASNVFLKNKITVAGDFAAVGNYKKGDEIAAGTSLESLFSGILQRELYPTNNDKPNVSITVNGGNGEVGSEYTVPTATLKITDVGSYPYEPIETGITFKVGKVKLAEGVDPDAATNYKTNTSVMKKNSTLSLKASGDKALYADTATKYTFSGTATHTDGVIPKTNLGNDYPDAQIKSGDVTIDDATATFTGWRYLFGGGTKADTINSAAIRATNKLKKSSESAPITSGGKGIIFSASKGDTKVVFAYPSDWTTKTPKFEIFTMAWGATSGFEKSTISVADYRGGENGLKEYTVYTYTPATPFAAEETQYCVYFI